MKQRITPQLSDSIFEGIEIPDDRVVSKQTQIAKRELSGWYEKNLARINTPEYRQLKSEKNLQRWQNTTAEQREQHGKKISKSKQETLEGYYIVRSPGNDLLDFYDYKFKENYERVLERGPGAKNNVGQVLHSVVYRIRYVEQYEQGKKAQRIKQILSEHVDLSKQTRLFYQGAEYTLHKWLTNKPSQQWVFKTKTEAYDFVQQQTANGLRFALFAVEQKHMILFNSKQRKT